MTHEICFHFAASPTQLPPCSDEEAIREDTPPDRTIFPEGSFAVPAPVPEAMTISDNTREEEGEEDDPSPEVEQAARVSATAVRDAMHTAVFFICDASPYCTGGLPRL